MSEGTYGDAVLARYADALAAQGASTFHQGGKAGPDELPSRAADDVADEEDSHEGVRRVYANPRELARPGRCAFCNRHIRIGIWEISI